jgi:hypothetical protein
MSDITINGQQAAVLHAGLTKAITIVEDMLKRKAADPFRGALTLELSAYRGEQSRLSQAFPELSDGHSKA